MTDDNGKVPGRPKNKGGRPRKHPVGTRLPTLAFRVRGDMHERLKAAADSRSRSLSEEIERRIDLSFELDQFWGGEAGARVARLVGAAIQDASKGRDWQDDAALKTVCRKAAVAIINVLMGLPINRLTASAAERGDDEKHTVEGYRIATSLLYGEVVKKAGDPPVPHPSRDSIKAEVEQKGSEFQ